MKPFTDDDLKAWNSVENTPKMKALLARLDAAEEFAESAALAYPSLKLGDSYHYWRKAKGDWLSHGAGSGCKCKACEAVI